MDFRRCYGCYGWCKSVARRLRLTFMVPKSYVRSNSGIKFAELTLQLFIKGWNIHPINSRFVKSWHTFLKSQIFILYHVMTEKEKMWVSKIYFDSNWGFIILTLRRPNLLGVHVPVSPDLAKTAKVRSDHSKNLTHVFDNAKNGNLG